MQPDLDAVLHAVAMMEMCRRVDCGELYYKDNNQEGLSRVGPMIGFLDWHAELSHIMTEAGIWKRE